VELIAVSPYSPYLAVEAVSAVGMVMCGEVRDLPAIGTLAVVIKDLA
jgi:hypothetical protein